MDFEGHNSVDKNLVLEFLTQDRNPSLFIAVLLKRPIFLLLEIILNLGLYKESMNYIKYLKIASKDCIQ